jgi:hypothetical protein
MLPVGIVGDCNNPLIVYQEQMLPRVGRSHKYKIILSSSRVSIKWLNVVLDLNGILCVCQEKRLMPRGQAYVDGSRPHSNIVSYLVGPKAVFICSSYQRFLRELSNMADITIRSSMKVTTTKSVCNLHN